ncbi:MAG TPA: flagellar hook-length control protein FliK, partial [Deltaproteobacteria bacterium]|nr:flagellar hook-length control protein FliK [Deltaproteobacteria bacterium]
ALALVRSATTKEEWSSIEGGIKLWRPDLQVPEAKLAFDKGAFNALASKLTGSQSSPAYEHIVERALDQIKINIPSQLNNNEGTATMRLNPPLLGRVEVTIVMEEGGLQATIRSDSQITRDMLQIHIATLKEALAEQGIRVNQLSIASGMDNRQGQQQQDAYAQLQQGRSNSDGQGRGSHHPGGGGAGREGGNGSYGETPSRNYLLSSGGLDLFA